MAYYPDISHWHPVKDWDTVKLNCPFIITKATQGTSYIDPTVTWFISACENRSIPYWLYTYLNKGDELAQAQYLVRVADQRISGGSRNFIGYILDVEAGNSATNVKQALDWLNKQGKKTMLYTMYAEYSRYKDVIANRGSNCAWWEARYGANNGQDTSRSYPCHSGVDLHQYTSKGFVPGIGSNIDLNKILQKGQSWYTTQKKVKPAPSGDTTLDIVADVMRGKYGSGEDRKKALGSRYQEVQNFINHIASADNQTLANEVIAGKYGTGETRKLILGNKYQAVQALVNKMI